MSQLNTPEKVEAFATISQHKNRFIDAKWTMFLGLIYPKLRYVLWGLAVAGIGIAYHFGTKDAGYYDGFPAGSIFDHDEWESTFGHFADEYAQQVNDGTRALRAQYMPGVLFGLFLILTAVVLAWIIGMAYLRIPAAASQLMIADRSGALGDYVLEQYKIQKGKEYSFDNLTQIENIMNLRLGAFLLELIVTGKPIEVDQNVYGAELEKLKALLNTGFGKVWMFSNGLAMSQPVDPSQADVAVSVPATTSSVNPAAPAMPAAHTLAPTQTPAVPAPAPTSPATAAARQAVPPSTAAAMPATPAAPTAPTVPSQPPAQGAGAGATQAPASAMAQPSQQPQVSPQAAHYPQAGQAQVYPYTVAQAQARAQATAYAQQMQGQVTAAQVPQAPTAGRPATPPPPPPAQAAQPVQSAQAVRPAQPMVQPAQAVPQPGYPAQGTQPAQAGQPVQAVQPGQSAQPARPVQYPQSPNSGAAPTV